MNNRMMMSVAAAALIAGTGFANAQGAGMSREGGGAPAAHSAPAAGGGAASANGAADRAAPAAGMEKNAPAGRDEATDTTNRSDQRQDMKAQSDDKVQRDHSQRATDTTRDNSKSPQDNAKNPNAKSASEDKADSKGMNNTRSTSSETKSTTTTGQAGAGAKLTTEQRTKVTTVIRQQNVKPVTNVNFSINVGTRVPRDVEFHPLPAEIVTVYPDWRGYDFILVNDQIIVINPSSYEIVAVIDA